ncbi:MAG: hypothetical protein ACK57B_11140 [Betaproteobacteria bacterium]|jgi:CRP/FNR family cyclic AMP-dependent transcriptional regulator
MVRILRKPSPQLGPDELLNQSTWFPDLSGTAQTEVRATLIERRLEAGELLGHDGERQLHWFGVAEGLLKWSIHAHDGRTVTLGGSRSAAGSARARCCATGRDARISSRCALAAWR